MAGEAVTAMRSRLEAIPTQILSWAWGYSSPDSTFEDVLGRAEKYLAHKESPRHPWPMDWQPFIAADQTRIIHEALAAHETAIDSDAIILRKLREWFGPEGQ